MNYNYATMNSPCVATAVQLSGPVSPISPLVMDPARAYAQMTTGVSTSVALQNNSFVGAPTPYAALQKGYGAPYVFTPLPSDASAIYSKSQFPGSVQNGNGSVNYTSYAASCPSILQTGANNCGDASYQMSIDALMPAGWSGAPNSALAVANNQIWTAFGPTKQAFERYITSAGAARLGMITRNPNTRITGSTWNLQDLRSQIAIPISAVATPWHDADQRQMLYYGSTGYFPQPGTF